MSDKPTAESELQSGLTGKLLAVFDSGVESRRGFYEANPDKVPSTREIDSIISACANTNAVISGGLSLLPGPWGLVAIIPQMVLVIQNQVKMIYDIGVASGKQSVLTRELILSIALSASGVSGMSLLTMHGSKILVRRSSVRVFQKLVAMFAGKVTQQVLKKSIALWLPIIGAAGIAVWTRYSTAEIGRKAKEIFAHEIEILPEGDADEESVVVGDAVGTASSLEALMVAKLLLLDDLMKCDGEAAPAEHAFINELLSRSGLGPESRMLLIKRFDEPSPRVVDLAPFRADRDEAIGLLIDLAAMAKRDGSLKDSERAFVVRTAHEVGLGENQVAAALA
ncbi:MAG: TerB family tellurite resistance protein [Myxococcota bacterium]